MGVSHSKNDEHVVDRHNNRTMSRSATMKNDSANNNLAAKNYLEKPRSVSSNDVISSADTSGNNNDFVASSSSSNSLSSSFRSKISLLKKPGAGFIRNSSTSGSGKSNASKSNSTTASSTVTVVNSFMTNMNSSNRSPAMGGIDENSTTNSLSAYPYPRAHSTNLLLPLRPSASSNADDSSGLTGLRRPLSYRRGQSSSSVVGSGYGRTSTAVLQIPSPVPSVSEPSASEDNLSLDTVSESDTTKGSIGGSTTGPLRYVDSPSHNSNNVVSGYVTTKPASASTSDEVFNRTIIDDPVAPALSASSSVLTSVNLCKSGTSGGDPAAGGVKNEIVQRPRLQAPASTSYGFNYATGIRANAPFRVRSINDDRLAETATGTAETRAGAVGSSTDNGCGDQRDKAEEKGECVEEAVVVATSVEEEEEQETTVSTDAVGDRCVKRPNSLLAKSNGHQQVVSYPSWKLRYKGGGAAPLAESECFIVENSPAVELPPATSVNIGAGGPFQSEYNSMTSTTKPETNNNETGVAKMNNNFRSTKPFNASGAGIGISAATTAATVSSVKSGTTTSMGTRFQSRLKNPSAYEQRQRFIYGRYAGAPAPATAKNERKLDGAGTVPVMETKTTKTQMGIVESVSNIPTTSRIGGAISGAVSKLAAKSMTTTNVTPKHELHDSGVKVDSGGGSAASSGSDTTGSKATSPEGSLHRGLIDDEIRDQPELTIGRSDGSVAEQPSQITTIQEEIPLTDVGGPVRLRDRARKRSSTTGLNNRMIESYDSTVSSLSIDSEDLMTDYEDLVEGEETDLVAPTAVMESASLHSSLGRRSSAVSRSSIGGGGSGAMGSLGRRKSSSLASGGKRASMEAMMGELTSLKNETEKGSNQSQQRQRALSDFPSPSSSIGGQQASSSQSPSHYNRILRPPLSLECAGLSTVSLDQQTYRHVVQDVTVMKTLLLRLKRSLQESETTNPFESSLNLKNGLAKSAVFELEMQKNDERLLQLTKDDLTEENGALRTQIAVMRQQLEEQNRIIQCLQHQLKLCRQRSLRKAESVGEHSLMKETDERKERATTAEPSDNNGPNGTVRTDV